MGIIEECLGKGGKKNKDYRDGRDSKENKVYRDGRDSKENKDYKDGKNHSGFGGV